jgi:hypothetical protein
MQKIKLYLETFDNSKYSLTPNCIEESDDGVKVYVFEHDPKTITNICVKLDYGKVIIKKIMCDDTHLVLLDRFGVYRSSDNKILYNHYGYMDTPGTYTFKIRYGAKVFHYMLYMLEKYSLK